MSANAATSRLGITQATAFIDWNSQIHVTRLRKDCSEEYIAEKVLAYVGRIIGRSLYLSSPERRFDVAVRIYHGWRKGFEITARRIALTQVAAGADFPSLSSVANVSIRRDIQFGDKLISALERRLHVSLNCHLPNTYRKSITLEGKMEEKMVDTAIASDVVDLAHREPLRWLLIVGDDDDLVPPVLAAEGIRGGTDGRILLIRTRKETAFLKIEDLRYKP